VSQQVLKLRVADLISTPTYVVLDAKNHLVRPTGLSSFVAPDGRPRANFYHYDAHPLRTSLERVLDYFGLERESHLARFTSTATPFILVTIVCRRLVADLEAREAKPFAELFVNRGFTEFFLYSAWLESTGTTLDVLYDDSGIPNPAVWPRGRGQAGVARVLDAASSPTTHFLSIHRTALARMGRSATDLLIAFWIERGFFSGRGEARRFILRYRTHYVVAMVRKRISERGQVTGHDGRP